MAEKRYYWIKLKDSFMTSDTVDFLMSQKGGANYVVLYQMICLKTINTQGLLARQIGEVIVPYNIDKIYRDCKYFEKDTIIVALELYKKLGLIYENNDKYLQIIGFEKLVGGETKWAEKQRDYRKKQDTLSDTLSDPLSDKRIDIKILDTRYKDIDINTKIKDNTSCQQSCQEVVDLYNSICLSFPKCSKLSEARKKAIKARLNTYSLEEIKKAFEIVESNEFLKGKNDRNWSANFDWTMKDANMAKIIDGNYSQKTKCGKVDSTIDKLNRIIGEA